MASSRPFAFNSGASVPGTDQLGQIAIGLTTSFSSSLGGLEWYNGPDEDLGYIICKTSSQRTFGNGSGNTSNTTIGFWRSTAKTENSFTTLVNNIFGQTISTGDLAKTYLNNAGYWTSWVSSLSSIPLNGILYYSSYFTDYLAPSSISVGNNITKFYKYDNNTATASSSEPYVFADIYTNGYATFSQLNGKNIAYSLGTYSTGASYSSVGYFDPTTDISFVHKPSESYTIYFVGKPEAITGGSYVFSTFNSVAPGEGFPYEYLELTSTYSINWSIYQGGVFGDPFETVMNLTLETNADSSTLNSKSLRVFSIRAQNQNNTSSIAAYGYVNGTLTSTASHPAIPDNTDPSLDALSIMGAPGLFGTEGPYKGYFGELLIYNELHSESTHTDIVNLLKTRWGIS